MIPPFENDLINDYTHNIRRDHSNNHRDIR